EQRERDADDRGEAAHAHVEAGAAEVRGVDTRIRQDAAALRKAARKRDSAVWIRRGQAHGGGPGRLASRELVREEGEGEASPGQIRLRAEAVERGGHGRKPLRLGG